MQDNNGYCKNRYYANNGFYEEDLQKARLFKSYPRALKKAIHDENSDNIFGTKYLIKNAEISIK